MLKNLHLPSPKQLYALDRPREKLLNLGVESLDDIELLSTIIGSGSKQRNVSEIALDVREILQKSPNNLRLDKLKIIKGLSIAKASQLIAGFELARRHTAKLQQQIKVAEDLWPWVSDIAGADQEHLVCLTLNGAGQIIQKRIVTVGTLDSTLIHPREVFANAITDRAASVILVHNHPSADVNPSEEDHRATKILREAGYILGIPILDHVIVNRHGQMHSLVNIDERA